MLFALCDLTTTVEVHHINAAMAWIRYSVESVKFIFASASDEAVATETNDAAQKIINYLTDTKSATRKDLTVNCFQGHASKSRIDAALDELLASNPPRIKVESIPRPKGAPGTATKIYQLTGANSANCANSEHSCGLAGEFTESELCEPCELSLEAIATVSTVSTVSTRENEAQTVVNIDTSHSSLSSQANAEKLEVL